MFGFVFGGSCGGVERVEVDVYTKPSTSSFSLGGHSTHKDMEASIWFFAYRNLEPPAAPSTPNPSAIIPSIARDRGLHGLPTSQQRALPQSERLVARGQTRAIRATWARGKRPYAGEAPVA